MDFVKPLFVDLYTKLRNWKRDNLPVGSSLVRLDVLVHLFHIYPDSSFVKNITGHVDANPRTIRSALEGMIEAGFVEEDMAPVDRRYRHYRLTAIAAEKMGEYAVLFTDRGSGAMDPALENASSNLGEAEPARTSEEEVSGPATHV